MLHVQNDAGKARLPRHRRIKLFFRANGIVISRHQKKEERTKIIEVLQQLLGQNMTEESWPIKNLHRTISAPHPRVSNLNYAIYSTRRIDISRIFEDLKTETNYLVGETTRKGFYYVINLGDYTHIEGTYVLYPEKIMFVTLKKD